MAFGKMNKLSTKFVLTKKELKAATDFVGPYDSQLILITQTGYEFRNQLKRHLGAGKNSQSDKLTNPFFDGKTNERKIALVNSSIKMDKIDSCISMHK